MIEQTLFPVTETPAVFPDDPSGYKSTGYKFIVREDTGKVLSCMSNDYKLVNNKDIIDVALPVLKKHNAQLKDNIQHGSGLYLMLK